MTPPPTVLIVDDDHDDRALARRIVLQELGDVRIIEIAEPQEFNLALTNGGFSLVVTDYDLRWGTGIEVLRAIRANAPDCPVVMFTGSGSQEVAVEAMKNGLDDYVVKSPRHVVRLGPAIRGAIERRRLHRRALDLEARLQNLLDRLKVGVFRVTIYCHLLECNAAFLKILGVASSDELADSDLLRRICWPAGTPGSSEFLRPLGVQSLRQIWLTRPDGRMVCVRITEITSRSDHDLVVDGLLEDVTALQGRAKQPEPGPPASDLPR